MKEISTVNNRTIFYSDINQDTNWKKHLPEKPWVGFIINNEKSDEDKAIIHKIAETCLNKNLKYACCAGRFSSTTHATFDSAIINKELNEKNESDICTTEHDDFGEGFWFACNIAYDPYIDLNFVVCLNLDNKSSEMQIKKLIELINNGWLPEE